jgi:hypothetical protein
MNASPVSTIASASRPVFGSVLALLGAAVADGVAPLVVPELELGFEPLLELGLDPLEAPVTTTVPCMFGWIAQM